MPPQPSARPSQDRALGPRALPFIGQIVGYNRNEQSDQYIDLCNSLGDIAALANNSNSTLGTVAAPAKDNMIRILRPSQAHIISCYLLFSLTPATAETKPWFRISVSTTNSLTDPTPVVPSSASILQNMITLTGSSSPYTQNATGAIVVDRLNLMQLIPQYGSTNFRPDFIVIGVHFDQTPAATSGYRLNQFEVTMSAMP